MERIPGLLVTLWTSEGQGTPVSDVAHLNNIRGVGFTSQRTYKYNHLGTKLQPDSKDLPTEESYHLWNWEVIQEQQAGTWSRPGSRGGCRYSYA